MSRAYKDKLVDNAAELGATGLDVEATVEKLSGADLAQVTLAVENGSTADVDFEATKVLGDNDAYAGSPNCASLSGADQERFAGEQ